jgi:hypothetical protein
MNNWIKIKEYWINLAHIKCINIGKSSISFDFGSGENDFLGFSCHKENKNFIQITEEQYEKIRMILADQLIGEII